jgi:hypothetical protein
MKRPLYSALFIVHVDSVDTWLAFERAERQPPHGTGLLNTGQAI